MLLTMIPTSCRGLRFKVNSPFYYSFARRKVIEGGGRVILESLLFNHTLLPSLHLLHPMYGLMIIKAMIIKLH